MFILEARHLKKSFGTDEVLRDVSFTLNAGERLGLVGVNGSGKTTLLKLIIGEMEADEGSISMLRGTSIAYLTQQYQPQAGLSVLEEARSALSSLDSLEARLRELEAQMGEAKGQELQDIYALYSRLTDRYEQGGGYETGSQVIGVLAGMGFTPEQFQQQASTLSGGELTRLGLARLLLQKPDLLLLDEPTNHLDMATLTWLEGYLKEFEGSLITVSHDRYFLDAICTSVMELIFGKVETYPGNYSQYLLLREARMAARDKAWVMQQREIARQQAIIKRFRSFNREKSIRAAESREKALQRIELLDKPMEEKQIVFRFEAKRRLGDIALSAQGLSKAFDSRALFSNLDFTIRGGERVALIGPNGIGKTTLLRCLMQAEHLDAGTVNFAPRAQIGYYDQRQLNLKDDNSILDEVWDAFPLKNQSQIRGALGLFLFRGDDVFLPIHILSGGEKGRVSLVKLMLQQDNILILDEPTNHLDADSRQVLEKALEAYQGTIIAVSHDRYFINSFANRILVMDEDGIRSYAGNYDDYQAELQRAQEETAGDAHLISKTEQSRIRRQQRLLEEQLESLQQEVSAAEQAVQDAENQLSRALERQADPEVYSNPEKASAQGQLCAQLRQDLNRLYSAWETAEQALCAFTETMGPSQP